MAYYAYKRVRDLLIEQGICDKYGNPVDKMKYGEDLINDYDGNIHDMAADLIEEQQRTITRLYAETQMMISTGHVVVDSKDVTS